VLYKSTFYLLTYFIYILAAGQLTLVALVVMVVCRRHLTHILAMRARCGRCAGSVKVSGCQSDWTVHCVCSMPTHISISRTSMSNRTSANCSVIDVFSLLKLSFQDCEKKLQNMLRTGSFLQEYMTWMCIK